LPSEPAKVSASARFLFGKCYGQLLEIATGVGYVRIEIKVFGSRERIIGRVASRPMGWIIALTDVEAARGGLGPTDSGSLAR